MFGKCKVCQEKEIRISELKEQIAYLRNILNPPPRINKYELQEDMIMSGANQEELDPATLQAEQLENERIQREVDMVFSGNTIEVEEVEQNG